MRRLQAKHYARPSASPRPISLVVIHTAELLAEVGRAWACARWFAGQLQDEPKASAHFVIDPGEVVESCALDLIAWHAPGANAHSIGIELCGFASWGDAEWSQPNGQAILELAGDLVGELCRRYHLPVRRLTPSEIRAGAHGIAGHYDVNEAHPGKSLHTDPGPGFPWGSLLVRAAGWV